MREKPLGEGSALEIWSSVSQSSIHVCARVYVLRVCKCATREPGSVVPAARAWPLAEGACVWGKSSQGPGAAGEGAARGSFRRGHTERGISQCEAWSSVKGK